MRDQGVIVASNVLEVLSEPIGCCDVSFDQCTRSDKDEANDAINDMREIRVKNVGNVILPFHSTIFYQRMHKRPYPYHL